MKCGSCRANFSSGQRTRLGTLRWRSIAGAWATRVGGTFAISTAVHAVTQHWARNIVEAFPDLDGLRDNSGFAGAPCLALFLPALTAMPGRPRLSLPLTHPDLASRIAGGAKRLGYSVI
jgi:hypothetical protein